MSNEKQTGDEEQHPIGTWVLLVLTAIAMTVAWMFLYLGVFLPRGTVN